MEHLTNQHIADRTRRFIREAEDVDSKVFTAESIRDLASILLDFLNESKITNLHCNIQGDCIWAEAISYIKNNGIVIITNTNRESLETHGAGLNAADFGIAETGTLVFFESAADEVRIGTIPKIHIVLLDAENIYEKSSELSGEIEKFITSQLEGGKPGRVSFISGPSRTADIERDLTIGVHGPETLALFILRNNNEVRI